jgi:diguanylate cyclase (GGDEF)-like protein
MEGTEKGTIQPDKSILSTNEDESISALIETNIKLTVQIDNLVLDNQRLRDRLKEVIQEKDDLEILVEAISDHSEQLNDELMEKVEVAQRDALTDALTAVPNRRFFDQHLDMEWSRSTRIKSVISLIMIDIDHFKHYNDYYGHLQGDECLKQVAQIINNACHRETDFLARYGGEEFAVIISDTEYLGVLNVAQRIVKEVHDAKIPHATSPVSRYVTVSLGCFSKIPMAGEISLDFIRQSDALLYQAKEKGRNQFVQLPV